MNIRNTTKLPEVDQVEPLSTDLSERIRTASGSAGKI